MPEPKDDVKTQNFMGFTNTACEFYPCHKLPERDDGKKREFSCLGCYCPLYFLECPGPYDLYTDSNGKQRKDCSKCTLPHNGYKASWKFIQKWMENPMFWKGQPQDPKRLK